MISVIKFIGYTLNVHLILLLKVLPLYRLEGLLKLLIYLVHLSCALLGLYSSINIFDILLLLVSGLFLGIKTLLISFSLL